MMPRTSRCRTRTGRPCFPGCTLVLAVVLALATAGGARAQSVTNPRSAEFEPSPDHATLLASGAPMVARYDLEIYRTGTAAPFHTVTLGKPSPYPDGLIRFDFWGQVTSWPLPGGTYEARVSAVGPDGIARSEISNPFTFTVASGCTFGLTTESLSIPAGGGTYPVGIAASSGCEWTASASTDWVAFSHTTGTGNWTLGVTVGANAAASSRHAALTIAGQTVTVSQAGAKVPLLGKPAAPLVIGKGNTVAGTSLTAGSMVKLFVSTAAGTKAYGPYKPTGWTPESLTFSIPRDVAPGNGFVAVQVVNTDTGYQESNLVGALLAGEASLGLPTITHIDGTAVAPADLRVGLAHIDTVVRKGATVTLTGTGFADPVVNVFTAAGNIGPLEPLAGATATEIRVAIPNSAPTGPGNFQVVNRPGYQVSAAVAAVLGAVPTISRVSASGGTITVDGTGFSPVSVINLYNKQGEIVLNLGGLGSGGAKVPLTVTRDTRLSFSRPPGAMAGAAFVEVLNPPFIPFASSRTDPDGAFAMPDAPPPILFTDAAPVPGETDAAATSDSTSATTGATREVVTWTRPVRAVVDGDTLSLAATGSSPDPAASAWRAGARSTHAILEGDGSVAWTVTPEAGDLAFGLGSRDADATPSDLAFAWRLDASTRELQVVERGVLKAAAGTYAPGDRLRIAIRNGVAEYTRNGASVWTSDQAPRYPLVADASLGAPGAELSGVQLAGRLGAVADWPAQPRLTATSMRAAIAARSAASPRPLLIGGATVVEADASGTRAVSATLAGTAGIGLGAAACDYCIVRTGGAVEVRHAGEVRGRWLADGEARCRVEVTAGGSVRYWAGDLWLDEAPLGGTPALALRGWLGPAPGAAIVGATCSAGCGIE
jgi:hypothetical protein